MKKIVFLFATFLFFAQLNAQISVPFNTNGTYINSGKNVFLLSVNFPYPGNNPVINLLIDNELKYFEFNELKRIKFEFSNLEEFWKYQALINSVYESLTKNGMQYDLRADWENDALRYFNEIYQRQLIFEDCYLENYLYSLIHKLYPGSINDGRPGVLNVKIMIDNVPNAFIFPNGSLIITTGLLSTINSEEELIGVMAHEISHFVLDHSAINLNKAIQRQKNADFWAGFVTTLVAVGEIYAASKDNYYMPGALTYSTAILSYSIAASFTERLGLKYSKQQELDADKCAVELMKYIKVDHTALASVLFKIKHYCLLTGNYFAISGGGTHPNIDDRISEIGVPGVFNSIKYDKLVSFVNSANAVIEFNNRHFKACQVLVDRNIMAHLPTEDDYILKAMTNLYLYDNVEKNTESLELINKAKLLNVVPTINTFKQEAMILLRLGRLPDALIAFATYNDKLDRELLNAVNLKNENSWYSRYLYLNEEKIWTSKMIYKVKSMKNN